MILNYLKIALRSGFKDGTTSVVNFLGLTVGIVSSLLIFLYVNHELSYDKQHRNYNHIFKVLSIDEAIGVSNNNVGITIPALAPGMKKEIPGIKDIVRINGSGKALVKYNDNLLYTERLIYTEPSFFEVFDFELLKGDPASCLTEPNSALLTETMAKKVFKDEDPMGKIFSADGTDNLQVKGILKDQREPSHIEYEIVVSMNPSPSDSNSIAYLESWNNISQTQYVLLDDPGKKDKIIVEMDSLLRRNDVLEAWSATLQPLKEVHLYSNDILFDNFNRDKGDIRYVRSLSLIAIIILLIASFNYMNLSTARSAKRAREVGVRKSIGATRKNLISQHLSEAIVQVFVALFVSLAILELINNYYQVIGISVFAYMVNNPVSILYLFLLGITLGTFSGIYPSVILSAYKPQIVLKGKFESGKKGLLLRRFLVTIQFIASFVMLAGIIVVFNQLRYTLDKDKGFDVSQIVNIQINRDMAESYDPFLSEMEKIPGIKQVANSGSMPGLGFGRTLVLPEGANEEENWIISVMSMDENYIPLMNMELLEGDNFRQDMSTDPVPIIVNESLIKAVGWESGLDKMLSQSNNRKLKITGVVKDFHFTSMRHQIEPIMMMYRAGANNITSVKVSEKNIKETLLSIESAWEKIFEGIPFEYQFYDESFNNLYQKEQDFSKMFFRFTLLSVFVAVLGLFGLAAFSAEQRTKEIGIRKTFGAGIKQMIFFQSHEYTKLVLLAIIVSAPLAYFLMKSWLQDFVYKIDLSVFPFIIAAIIIFIITIVTVSIQSYKAAVKNPAETLKYE